MNLNLIKAALTEVDKICLAPPPDLPGLFDLSLILSSAQRKDVAVEVWDTRSLRVEDLIRAIESPRQDVGAWADAERIRVYADWIVGLNGSRAMTLYGRVAKAIPVGRVLSALLGTFPPKPQDLCPAERFDTATIQAWMLREHGWQPSRTLMTLQSHYEQGRITYPFTSRRHAYGSASAFPGAIQIRKREPLVREDPLLAALYQREQRVAHGDVAPTTFGLCPQADWLESITDLRPWITDPHLREQAHGIQLGSPRARMGHLARLIEYGWVDPVRLDLLPAGKQVMEILPKSLTDLGTVVAWEKRLEHVAMSQMPARAFQSWAERYVTEFLGWLQKEKVHVACQ